MGRSGTTLLDKLLTNHRDITVLSQPFPLVFIELKKKFLKEIGLDKYYVLNDDLISKEYSQNKLDKYLENLTMSIDTLKSIFKTMENYSGQTTKIDFPINQDVKLLHSYKKVFEKCLQLYQVDSNISYLGTKEIMCEESLPYLCHNNYKCIIIVRDPRDVLASANYPKGEKYLGAKKPTLFILKSWRKSVEYIYTLKDNDNFYFLCYEDLVNDPYNELNKITEFLGLDKFQKGQFTNGIYDRNGELWSANTSFGNMDTFISTKSIGIYKNILTKEEISYTEVVCHNEMKWLGYNTQIHTNSSTIIENFEDYDIQAHHHIPSDFTSQNKLLEIDRYEKYKKFYKSC